MSNKSPENGISTVIVPDEDLRIDTRGCKVCQKIETISRASRKLFEEFHTDSEKIYDIAAFMHDWGDRNGVVMSVDVTITDGYRSRDIWRSFFTDISLTNCAKCKGKNPDTGPVLAVEEYYYFVLRRGS